MNLYKFIERRLELLAVDTGWNVTGPIYKDDKAVVGRVFLQRASGKGGVRIVIMVSERGGEHNITNTLPPAELLAWMDGALWAIRNAKKPTKAGVSVDLPSRHTTYTINAIEEDGNAI